MHTFPGYPRAGFRIGVAGLLTGTALLALPSAASAHVDVQPDEVPGGGFSVISFRVPNERDDASTTKVRVLLPVDQPLASVQTTPMPGWDIATKDRAVDEPIDFFGSKVSSVVSEVTWSATGPGLRPGQFQDFAVSVGQLPDSGEMVFRAVQTYSSGEVVKWNEVSVDDSVEPEHPAPVLTLTAGEDDGHDDQGSTPTTEPSEDASVTSVSSPTESGSDAESDGGSTSGLATGLSVAALLVALAALAMAWRRGRA
jgi:uncharacterized protein YcnI